MPFNGSGTYSLPAGNPVVTGTTISSSTTNTTNSDLATALTNCITRDGQSTPSANLPMNAKKLTGLAAGTSAGDSVRYDELQTLQTQVNGIAGGFSTLQLITSSGAFTIPTGKTVIKVTVIGGGGGGAAAGSSGGGTGGTSSVASGTQTISTVSADGGQGNAALSSQGALGGTASGGGININGAPGGGGSDPTPGTGGSSIYGAGGVVYRSTVGNGGAGVYGGGGAGANSGGGYGAYNGGGGAGATAIKYLTSLTPGNTLTITIGAGGAGATGSIKNGGAGGAGIVVVEY
jgi:hypothetical protein